jgi:hypothetical protein
MRAEENARGQRHGRKKRAQLFSDLPAPALDRATAPRLST